MINNGSLEREIASLPPSRLPTLNEGKARSSKGLGNSINFECLPFSPPLLSYEDEYYPDAHSINRHFLSLAELPTKGIARPKKYSYIYIYIYRYFRVIPYTLFQTGERERKSIQIVRASGIVLCFTINTGGWNPESRNQ